MKKKIGTALILVENKDNIPKLNNILNNHSSIIIGRQGIPLRNKGINIISIVLEGTTDDIDSLTVQIGKLNGIQVKSMLIKN
jgi:putative iron-only hydrogenase system regulator